MPKAAHSSGSRVAPWVVLAMLGMLALPAAITLNTVQEPGKLILSTSNPTPHGYTWSLLLFVIPTIVIAFWLLPSEHVKFSRSSFWRTIGLLAPFGCGLDFFFAHRFFTFPNSAATLSVGAPALGAPVPVEEYIFYITGFITVLLLYIWLDEYWLAAYNVPDYSGQAKMMPRLLQFHPGSAIAGVLLIAGAIVFKKFFSASREGFPGYFTFLVSAGLLPAASFYPVAKRFINWRAFSLTLFFILLVSLLWEATLALPYGWWGYQPNQMVGISIRGWSGLPIEAVFVWIAVTYATTVVFEVVKIWRASEKPLRRALLGEKRPSPAVKSHVAGREA